MCVNFELKIVTVLTIKAGGFPQIVLYACVNLAFGLIFLEKLSIMPHDNLKRVAKSVCDMIFSSKGRGVT